MRKVIFTTACLGALLAFMPGLFAQGGNTAGQVNGTKTITTAVPFLLVAPDSRSAGIGEAGVAVTNDANAMHWNPSAMAFFEDRMGFSMSYSPWLRALGIPDINLMYLSGYYNTGGSGVIGASLRYFSLGEIEFTDGLGIPIGSDKPNEFALDVGYALKVSDRLSAAISLRYIYSRLASNGGLVGNARPVNSAAGDLSFSYNKPFKIKGATDLPVLFTSGVNITNIGPKVSYTSSTADKDFIPINLRFGYAFKFDVDEFNSITFTNDFNKLLVPSEGGRSDIPLLQGMFGSFGDATGGFGEEISEFNTAVGLEYWYRELFAARAGFFYEDPQKGNRKFLTFGAGIKYNVFGIDFAYLSPLQRNHPLQNTLRFTLTYDFDSAGNE
ncbi:MAG: type IX secretion system outer membrane channel protein PorV [Bacteroidetes bacterium]|nr:type IX secretion system outer membrane channel protein PorV [Bacteroidota bacterium]MCB0842086.1 type IX secretion system outer membrane channel protein PorV [Bacteroidota bacterium]MCB0852260.1 type IX secretion system outer membrane channel protein PorV [Bacteroidota bacterium]